MGKELEIRCFCNRKPMLAVAGRDTKSGALYVHIKSVKGDRINAEAIITSGIVRIHCRECLRWHTVKIITPDLDVKAERLPESIAV